MSARKINGLYIGSKTIAALRARRTEEGWVSDGWAVEEYSGDAREAIGRAVRSLGLRGSIAVSIPDTSVNVSFLDLDELPGKKELDGIVRWKLSKALNQSPGDMRFDCQVLKESPARVLAVSLKNGAGAFEDAVEGLGLEVSRMSTHSFNLANLVTPKAEGAFSVLAVVEDYFAVMFFRNGAMDFFRCRPFGGAEGLRKELTATFLSYTGRNRDAAAGAVYIFQEGKGLEDALGDLARPEPVEAGGILKLSDTVDGGTRLKLLAAFGAGIL